jgi:DNA-binding NarL/FixJ family response regulator
MLALDSCTQSYPDAAATVHGANGHSTASTNWQNSDANASSERTINAIERFALIDALTRAEEHGVVALSMEGRGVAAVVTATFRLPLNDLNVVDAATLAAMVDRLDISDRPASPWMLRHLSGYAALPVSMVARTNVLETLTSREKEVLGVLVCGGGSKAIARRVGITESAVKTHLKSIFLKLGVANRAQAAVMASKLGLEG